MWTYKKIHSPKVDVIDIPLPEADSSISSSGQHVTFWALGKRWELKTQVAVRSGICIIFSHVKTSILHTCKIFNPTVRVRTTASDIFFNQMNCLLVTTLRYSLKIFKNHNSAWLKSKPHHVWVKPAIFSKQAEMAEVSAKVHKEKCSI